MLWWNKEFRRDRRRLPPPNETFTPRRRRLQTQKLPRLASLLKNSVERSFMFRTVLVTLITMAALVAGRCHIRRR